MAASDPQQAPWQGISLRWSSRRAVFDRRSLAFVRQRVCAWRAHFSVARRKYAVVLLVRPRSLACLRLRLSAMLFRYPFLSSTTFCSSSAQARNGSLAVALGSRYTLHACRRGRFSWIYRSVP